MPCRLIGVDFPVREVSEALAEEHLPRPHLHPAHLAVFPGCPFEPRCSFAMEVCRQGPPGARL